MGKRYARFFVSFFLAVSLLTVTAYAKISDFDHVNVVGGGKQNSKVFTSGAIFDRLVMADDCTTAEYTDLIYRLYAVECSYYGKTAESKTDFYALHDMSVYYWEQSVSNLHTVVITEKDPLIVQGKQPVLTISFSVLYDTTNLYQRTVNFLYKWIDEDSEEIPASYSDSESPYRPDTSEPASSTPSSDPSSSGGGGSSNPGGGDSSSPDDGGGSDASQSYESILVSDYTMSSTRPDFGGGNVSAVLPQLPSDGNPAKPNYSDTYSADVPNLPEDEETAKPDYGNLYSAAVPDLPEDEPTATPNFDLHYNPGRFLIGDEWYDYEPVDDTKYNAGLTVTMDEPFEKEDTLETINDSLVTVAFAIGAVAFLLLKGRMNK